jgi:hypothetical protein
MITSELENQKHDSISNKFLRLISEVHGPAEDFVTCEIFKIALDHNEIAKIVIIRSLPFYTAANILNVCFVAPNSYENLNVDDLLAFLKANVRDLPSNVEFLNGDSALGSLQKTNTPKDWYLLHRDEMGSVLSTLKRSICSVMKKYREV